MAAACGGLRVIAPKPSSFDGKGTLYSSGYVCFGVGGGRGLCTLLHFVVACVQFVRSVLASPIVVIFSSPTTGMFHEFPRLFPDYYNHHYSRPTQASLSRAVPGKGIWGDFAHGPLVCLLLGVKRSSWQRNKCTQLQSTPIR